MSFLKQLSIFSLILVSFNSYGMDYTVSGDLTLFQGYRILRGLNASDYLNVDDSVGVFGLDTKLETSSVVFDLKGRLIGAYSPGLKSEATDPAYLDLKPPKRFFDWEGDSANKTSSQTFSEIEKAFLMYQESGFEASIGRRAVGIGTLKYLPIWNRFIPSVAQIGGPALIYNPDNVQISYQLNKYAILGVHIADELEKDNMDFLVNTWYLDWIEIHALVGSWWQRTTAGLAFVKDLEGLTLRGESLFFQGFQKKDQMEYQVGLGIEYALTSKFSILAEGLYSSIGASNTSEYLSIPRDPFSILNANSYFFGELEYLLFDFWKISVGSLYNVMDSSYFAIGEVKYSWSNNLDILFQIKQPIGGLGQEFGSDFFRIDEDVNFGYSQQVSVQMNYFF